MQRLPEDFIERIKKEMPDDHQAFLDSFDKPVKTSVLLNLNKPSGSFMDQDKVEWCANGRYLNERPLFTLDPLFHAGCYYPQESSSMFLHHVLSSIDLPQTSMRALDMCASPGGKSIIMSSFIENRGILISNEIQRTRNHILLENLTKWGSDNTIVTCNDTAAFKQLPDYFDLILTDAPCSGEGMFRKDETAREEWSVANTEMCSTRQRDILRNAVEALKPGGYLIYSTCTFAQIENEDIVEWLVDEFGLESIEIPVDRFPNVRSVSKSGIHGARFLPHLVRGEGLFMSVLRKDEGIPAKARSTKLKVVFSDPGAAFRQRIESWIDTTDMIPVLSSSGDIFLSRLNLQELNFLAERLFIVSPGIEIGKFLRDDLIPAHALAMSPHLNRNVRRYDVSLDEALLYLRGETFPADTSAGWVVVTFCNQPLGWIKVIQGRFNNYYPKQWRIRMSLK